MKEGAAAGRGVTRQKTDAKRIARPAATVQQLTHAGVSLKKQAGHSLSLDDMADLKDDAFEKF